jgi:hypothetical protein
MMEAVRTSETSVDNHFTRQYNPEYSSEHHTRRRENLKSHTVFSLFYAFIYTHNNVYSSLKNTVPPLLVSKRQSFYTPVVKHIAAIQNPVS